MDAKTYEAKLVESLNKLASRIKEVKSCIGFKQLKHAEKPCDSYPRLFGLSEAEVSLAEAITELYKAFFGLLILQSESKDTKQSPKILEVIEKYSPRINKLMSEAGQLLKRYG